MEWYVGDEDEMLQDKEQKTEMKNKECEAREASDQKSYMDQNTIVAAGGKTSYHATIKKTCVLGYQDCMRLQSLDSRW